MAKNSKGSDALSGVLCELRRFPLFESHKQDELERFCLGGVVQVHRHREALFQHGAQANHFALVLGGAYKLYRMNPKGEDTIVYFALPGDVIGALIMPQTNPVYPVTVSAMGPSRIVLLPRDLYLKEWMQNEDLVQRVHGLFSERLLTLQEQKLMLRAPLASRIASLILQMDSMGDSFDKNEWVLPFPLTRKEIADTLGVTVESVIRVMSDWSSHGYVQTTDQVIRILQPAALVKLAQA